MDQNYVVEDGTLSLPYHMGAAALPNNKLLLMINVCVMPAYSMQNQQEGRETLRRANDWHVNCGLPKFGGRNAPMGWALVVFLHVVYTKPLDI